jgi:hypothetical protein
MDYRTTDVYKFFLAIEEYAIGDLNLFHKLSLEAETKDVSDTNGIESNDTAPPTTMYPYGFEVNFGKPTNKRATIPFAMMIFSCMDVIGAILKGGKPKATALNIEEFYNHIAQKPNKVELDCLIKLFRHGLAHNYFPKRGQAISYHSKNPKALFFKNGSEICLNVNVLEKNFVDGFTLVKTSEELYPQMNINFAKLNAAYAKERCLLLDNN